jgi:hypothetical protein
MQPSNTPAQGEVSIGVDHGNPLQPTNAVGYTLVTRDPHGNISRTENVSAREMRRIMDRERRKVLRGRRLSVEDVAKSTVTSYDVAEKNEREPNKRVRIAHVEGLNPAGYGGPGRKGRRAWEREMRHRVQLAVREALDVGASAEDFRKVREMIERAGGAEVATDTIRGELMTRAEITVAVAALARRRYRGEGNVGWAQVAVLIDATDEHFAELRHEFVRLALATNCLRRRVGLILRALHLTGSIEPAGTDIVLVEGVCVRASAWRARQAA